MAQHAQKLNLLRKTIAAAAGVRGDLQSLQGSLSSFGAATEPSSSRTQAGQQQSSYFHNGWAPVGTAYSTGLQGLPSLLTKQQQDNAAQADSRASGWPSIQDMLLQNAWATSTPTAQISTPAGPSLPLAPTSTKDSGPSRALLASLLSQGQVLPNVGRVLEQAGARKSSHLLPQQQLQGSKRPGQPQSGLPRPGGNMRGNARSITLNKDITATSSIEQLLALVKAHGHEFDFFNISTAISRMPKLVGDAPAAAANRNSNQQVPDLDAAPTATSQQDASTAGTHTNAVASKPAAPCANSAHLSIPVRDLADCLCNLALRHVHEFDGRGLANTAWAFAKLRYVPDAALPAALCRAAITRIDQFAAQNVSNLAWALVYLHYQDEQLMHLLKRKACEQVCEMKPQELANMMWALASHEQLDEHTARVLGQRAARMAHQFKEQELSNVVWAMGRCGHTYNPDPLEPLLSVVRCRLGAFMPQGVSNMVWALGQMDHHDPVLMAALSRECPHQLHNYDGQALSNLATGLSALGLSTDPALMAAIAQEAASRGTRMPPQHMASVLAAATTIGVHNDRLLSSATDLLQSRASALDPTTLASLAGVVVHLSTHPAPPGALPSSMLPALAHAVINCADKLNGQALVSLTVHFSKLGGAVAADVLPHLAARLPAAVPALTPQHATAMAWALQQAGAMTPELAPALLRHAMMSVAQEGQEATCALQLSTALTSAARCGYVPDASTQEALLAATLGAVQHMDVSQLCSSCWALAAMHVLDADSLSAFNHMLEGHAAMGAMTSNDLAAMQLQQVSDAYMMVAAQTSQRLGVPLTDMPQQLMPQLPPLVEAAMAQSTALSGGSAVSAAAQQQAEQDEARKMAELFTSPQLAELLSDIEAAKALLRTVQARNDAAAFTRTAPSASDANPTLDSTLDLAALSYDISAAAVLSAAMHAPPPPSHSASRSAAQVAMVRPTHSRGSPNLSSSQIAAGMPINFELSPTSLSSWGQLAGGLWNAGGLGNGTTLTEPSSAMSGARGTSEFGSSSSPSTGRGTSPEPMTVVPFMSHAAFKASASSNGSSPQRAHVGSPDVQSAQVSGSFATSGSNAQDSQGALARVESLEDVGGWYLPRELSCL